MPAPMLDWQTETPGLATATTGDVRGRLPVFLVAEAAETGGWDWQAWSNKGRRPSLKGVERSKGLAIRQAELAAKMIWVAHTIEKG